MQFVKSDRNWTGASKLAKIKTQDCTAIRSFMCVPGCVGKLAGFVHCSLNRSYWKQKTMLQNLPQMTSTSNPFFSINLLWCGEIESKF